MKYFIIFVTIISILSPACNKIENYNFRFEITITSSVASPEATITMGIGSGIRKFSSLTTGPTWTETRSLETALLPINLVLNASTIYLTGPGEATFRIYVNDKEKVTKTITTVQQNNQFLIIPTVISYTVN
jgi:hypothetical protein